MSLAEVRTKAGPANAVGRTDKDTTMAAIKDNVALRAIETSGYLSNSEMNVCLNERIARSLKGVKWADQVKKFWGIFWH
jgi:hypothetical protein